MMMMMMMTMMTSLWWWWLSNWLWKTSSFFVKGGFCELGLSRSGMYCSPKWHKFLLWQQTENVRKKNLVKAHYITVWCALRSGWWGVLLLLHVSEGGGGSCADQNTFLKTEVEKFSLKYLRNTAYKIWEIQPTRSEKYRFQDLRNTLETVVKPKWGALLSTWVSEVVAAGDRGTGGRIWAPTPPPPPPRSVQLELPTCHHPLFSHLRLLESWNLGILTPLFLPNCHRLDQVGRSCYLPFPKKL